MIVDGFDISKVGGRVLSMGKDAEESVLWFGWIPEQKTHPEAEDILLKWAPGIQGIREEATPKLPRFKLDGPWKDTREKSNNCEIMKRVHKEFFSDEEILQIVQISGSCVGASGGHVWYQGNCIEIGLLGEFWEDLIIPFWLLCYGKSRSNLGMRKGDGSLVSSFGECIVRYGMVDARMEGLPKFTVNSEGLQYTNAIEIDLSTGNVPNDILEIGKQHVAGQVAVVTSIDQAIAALDNGYAIHHGSSWGGKMRCPVVSDPPVLLNTKVGVWQHAMATTDYWFHPKLGLLFWVRNTWGRSVHGVCPSGMPRGGFWVRADEWEAIILKKGECRVYSNQKGFKVRYKQLAKLAA